jgi:hypothetical protein
METTQKGKTPNKSRQNLHLLQVHPTTKAVLSEKQLHFARNAGAKKRRGDPPSVVVARALQQGKLGANSGLL